MALNVTIEADGDTLDNLNWIATVFGPMVDRIEAGEMTIEQYNRDIREAQSKIEDLVTELSD